MARPSKTNVITNYINTIVGGNVTTTALAVATDCSLPTVLAYIKAHPHRFHRVARGTYRIEPENAANDTIATNETNTQFDW